MTLPARIERVYRVRFDEAGPDGMLRASGYLRFAQDLAWIHSESAGFDREWYAERAQTWLVRSVQLDVLDDVEYGTEIIVSTEVVGFRRVIARRRSEFRARGAERPLAVAITDWVLLNGAGRPMRPPTEILEAFGDESDAFTVLRVRLDSAPTTAPDSVFSVRRSETDPLAHVNNAAYLDYLDEHYATAFDVSAAARLPVPRRYSAEFVGSALPHAQLTAQGWPAGHIWAYSIADDARRELFRATLEIGAATPTGG